MSSPSNIKLWDFEGLRGFWANVRFLDLFLVSSWFGDGKLLWKFKVSSLTPPRETDVAQLGLDPVA